MSLMRSYSYGIFRGMDEIPEDVLKLFSSLCEHPEKKIEYASEIISAGLAGKINLNSEFYLDAYEARIRKNLFLGKENKRKKEVFLDFKDSSDDYEDIARNGGITEDKATFNAVSKMEDAYEQLLNEDELRYAIETIKGLRKDFLVEERMDIIITLKQALTGIPESINKLKEVCNNYSVVGEQIKIILSSGYTFEELFAC